jgi:hypothetical protein
MSKKIIFSVNLRDEDQSGGYLKRTYSVKKDIVIEYLKALPQLFVVDFEPKAVNDDTASINVTDKESVKIKDNLRENLKADSIDAEISGIDKFIQEIEKDGADPDELHMKVLERLDQKSVLREEAQNARSLAPSVESVTATPMKITMKQKFMLMHRYNSEGCWGYLTLSHCENPDNKAERSVSYFMELSYCEFAKSLISSLVELYQKDGPVVYTRQSDYTREQNTFDFEGSDGDIQPMEIHLPSSVYRVGDFKSTFDVIDRVANIFNFSIFNWKNFTAYDYSTKIGTESAKMLGRTGAVKGDLVSCFNLHPVYNENIYVRFFSVKHEGNYHCTVYMGISEHPSVLECAVLNYVTDFTTA